MWPKHPPAKSSAEPGAPRRSALHLPALLLAGLAAACDARPRPAGDPSPRDASAADAQAAGDLGAADQGGADASPEDASQLADVPAIDAGLSEDAAALDASPIVDASPALDAAARDASQLADAGASGPASFVRHTVSAAIAGPAFVTVADLEGDGSLELVVSAFGTIGLGGAPSGEVKVYARGAGLAMWTEREVVIPSSAGVKFPNQTRALDLDGDRDLDLIVPYGFLVCTAIPGGAPCGGLSWYERTPSGWTPHAIVPAGAELFYHGVDVVDFDGDGRLDLVTVGERAQDALRGRPAQAQAQWFKGVAGPARFETTPRIIGEGLGSFPQVIDLDGDGDLDVVSAEFFTDASFAWFERTAAPSAADPAGRFTRHVIDRDSGPSIMLRVVDDLFGDGIRRVLGSNHSNTARLRPDPWPSAVYVLDPPMDPRQPWTKRAISTGITSARGSLLAPQAAPGIFGVGDLDGDGDLDVAVAGDGDPKVYWLEQTSRGQFTTHVLEAMLSQAGGMQVVDLDGDGRREIVVTGYDANVVYVYARR